MTCVHSNNKHFKNSYESSKLISRGKVSIFRLSKNALVNVCPKFNQTIVNLVVGQITNSGDFHKFCICLRFEGRNYENCTDVTINMHFENTKIKT